MVQPVGDLLKNRNVVAWIMLISAIAIHVLDEATSGFLPLYNALIIDLRTQLDFFPVPTFSFAAWLGGLLLLVAICFLLTPIVHRGGRIMRRVATMLGVLMTLNASAHLIGSIYAGELLPGFWSSSLLLGTAVWVVIRGFDSRSWVPAR